MANTNINAEQESGGGFEKLLFFITPAIFTVILIGVLFTLFNIDARHLVMKIGAEIPILNQWLPKPDAQENAASTKMPEDTAEKIINELKKRLADGEAALAEAQALNQTYEQKIDELQEQLAAAQTEAEEKRLTAEEYKQQIRSLASMYGQLSPGKAAPILEQLTVEEQALILSEMKTDERARVLAKMDPKAAAEASIRLKDLQPAEDAQIAALQARIKQLEAAGREEEPSSVGDNDMERTFAGMDPQRSAELLLALNKTDRNQVLKMLKTMDNGTRSAVLSAMAEQSRTETAKLLSALFPN